MGPVDPEHDATRVLEVRDQHTALALGSGDVEVLGTPALLALAEGACIEVIAHALAEGETSVGTYAEVEHLAATPVGSSITARARLRSHEGRHLDFEVIVEQDGDTIARVRHRRAVVDRARFAAQAGVAS